MIPYEDLVSALTVWRERNGLPTGASDYLGEPPAPEPVSFAAYESRPNHAVDEVMVTEDWDAEPEPIEETPIEDWGLDALEEAPFEEAPAERNEYGFSTDDLVAAHAGDAIAVDLAVEEPYDPGSVGGDIWGSSGDPHGESDDLAAFGDETFNEPIVESPLEADEYPALETESPPVDIEDNFDPPPPIEPVAGEATEIGVEPAPEDDRDDFF